MSRWRPEPFGIGIGAGGIACGAAGTEPSRLPLASAESSNPGHHDHDRATALAALLQHAAPAASRTRARVVLADGLLRYWMLQPPPAVGSLHELQAVAQARFTQLFGGPQGWQVTGDWRAGRHAFLCVALPNWVAQGVRQALGPRPVLLAALAEVLRRHRAVARQEGWVCITAPGSTSLLGYATGRLCSVRVLPARPDTAFDTCLADAARELRRESLRWQLPLDGAVRWHDAAGGTPPGTAGHACGGIRFEPVGLAAPASDRDDAVAAWALAV